eukprot:m.216723 g.216723  ORF g.216723 m.216723 type:complete len:397 (-) comp13809_c3_seq3:367-1557(-)
MVATCAQLQLSVRYGVTQANKIRAKVFDPKGAITKCRIRLDPTASTEGFDGLRITFVPTCVGTYNASLIIDERIVRQTFKCEYNNEPAATLIQMVPIPIKKNKSLSQPSSSSTLQPIKAEVRRTNSWVLLFLFLSFTHALTANDLFPCCLVANCREDCDVYCTICSATKKVVVVDKLGYCKKHLQSELFSSKNMVVLKGRDIQVALKSFKKLRVARVGFISQQQGVALILAMVKNIVGPGRTLADEETLRSFAADTVTHFSEPDDVLVLFILLSFVLLLVFVVAPFSCCWFFFSFSFWGRPLTFVVFVYSKYLYLAIVIVVLLPSVAVRGCSVAIAVKGVGRRKDTKERVTSKEEEGEENNERRNATTAQFRIIAYDFDDFSITTQVNGCASSNKN